MLHVPNTTTVSHSVRITVPPPLGSDTMTDSGLVSATSDARREQAECFLGMLKNLYPNVSTDLEYDNPWELLVATALSAQTTDSTVNKVTKILFEKYSTPEELAASQIDDVEQIIFSTGFYRQKARSIIELSADLVERFDGEVPITIEELVTLRGVGRKTASVVLGEAFKVPSIAVDTHVKRVSRRLGLTANNDPVKIEFDLKALYTENEWAGIAMRFIRFGRDVCEAKKPRCEICEMAERCPWFLRTNVL